VILVVDASVALKWFFSARSDEPDGDHALSILEGIGSGRLRMVQPPHFLAEMAAVLAREKRDGAYADLGDLQRIEWDEADDPQLYPVAVGLAVRLGQHVFDTLYHATALGTEGATLVTADRRYFRRAHGIGRIAWLSDWEVDAGTDRA